MRPKVVLPAVWLTAVLLASCSSGDAALNSSELGTGVDETTAPSSASTLPVTETATAGPGLEAQIDETLAAMTVEQKVGQLLMPVLAGTSATGVSAGDAELNLRAAGFESPDRIVSEYHLGGVLYLENNIESAEQLRVLSEDLQQAATTSTGVGLLVAVDQEGGRVNRITDQVSVYPSASDLDGNVQFVTEASYVTGQQLQRQGINVVLAPVADVVLPGRPGFIGDRSFGDDPDVVAKMVSGSVIGLQQSGVAAAVKHWPGHGATSTDSHLQLPELDVNRSSWDARERIPFDAAIENGVAIVVVGHLAVPGLDSSGAPATLSSVIIDDLLRGEMGFDGVVMTDALNMGAVGEYDEGSLAVSAILAGADILLVPPDLASAHQALLDAVDRNALTVERLDQSVRRILELKQDLDLLVPSP